METAQRTAQSQPGTSNETVQQVFRRVQRQLLQAGMDLLPDEECASKDQADLEVFSHMLHRLSLSPEKHRLRASIEILRREYRCIAGTR